MDIWVKLFKFVYSYLFKEEMAPRIFTLPVIDRTTLCYGCLCVVSLNTPRFISLNETENIHFCYYCYRRYAPGIAIHLGLPTPRSTKCVTCGEYYLNNEICFHCSGKRKVQNRGKIIWKIYGF